MGEMMRRREYWLEHPDRFYECYERETFIEVKGKPIRLDGMGEADLLVYLKPGWGWRAAEGMTGCGFSSANGQKYQLTEDHAIQAAQRWIERYNLTDRAKMVDWQQRLVARYGLSPRYHMEETAE